MSNVSSQWMEQLPPPKKKTAIVSSPKLSSNSAETSKFPQPQDSNHLGFPTSGLKIRGHAPRYLLRL